MYNAINALIVRVNLKQYYILQKHRTPIGEKYLGRDNLRHFTDHYHDSKSKTYIVSELPSPMYHDFEVIPSLGACGEMSRRFVEIDIWWSGGNSKSLLHKVR